MHSVASMSMSMKVVGVLLARQTGSWVGLSTKSLRTCYETMTTIHKLSLALPQASVSTLCLVLLFWCAVEFVSDITLHSLHTKFY